MLFTKIFINLLIKMSNRQYCFNINNPKKVEIDEENLKNFIYNIYVGTKEKQFNPEEKIPFFTIYAESDNNVCIILTSRGKKNIERIEDINNSLTTKDLTYNKLSKITISKPFLFEVEQENWWENKQDNNDKKWNSLQQKGPYFTHLMEPYIPLGASLIYEGKKYKLTPDEEKIASMYAKRIISEKGGDIAKNAEWTKDEVFNSNFWNDFKQYLTPEHRKIFKKFDKIGWSDIVNLLELDKEKQSTKDNKLSRRVKTEEKKREYGYVLLDGRREKIGNFIIEPQAIFYGRGKNPNRGKIKKEINPEDVTLNIGPKDPKPIAPKGHKWGEIVHDQNAVWLARWKDTITNEVKYVYFSMEGRFKGESDLSKYEIARKLQMHIEIVRKRYMINAKSTNSIKMQLGTVLYLIDHFGVRVGNERKAEETDTVGASTLRVENVKLESPKYVIFDFYGKDSIRFYKKLEVPSIIYNNFKQLLSNKSGSTQVFDLISSKSINAYLKEFDKEFHAKVFRTRLASNIMYNSLKDVHVPSKSTKQKTKQLFNNANVKVADVLNHTRTVSKKAEESVKKFRDKLNESIKERRTILARGGSTVKIDEKIQNLEDKISDKVNVTNVAINTSLTNYIDPRIVVSWSKSENADLSAIYTAQLMRKFKWAVDTTDAGWDWLNSPLEGNKKLNPENNKNAVTMSMIDDIKRSKTRKSVISSKKTEINDEDYDEDTPISIKNISKVNNSSVQGYNKLLEICENPYKSKLELYRIPKSVLDWVYPYSKTALQKGFNKKFNRYLVDFYESVYKK